MAAVLDALTARELWLIRLLGTSTTSSRKFLAAGESQAQGVRLESEGFGDLELVVGFGV